MTLIQLYIMNRIVVEDAIERGYDAQDAIIDIAGDYDTLEFSDNFLKTIKEIAGLEEISDFLHNDYFASSPYIFDDYEKAKNIVAIAEKTTFADITPEDKEAFLELVDYYRWIAKYGNEAIVGYFV